MAGRDLQPTQTSPDAARFFHFAHLIEVLIASGLTEQKFVSLLHSVRKHHIVPDEDCIEWMGIDAELWNRWVTYEEVPDDHQQLALAEFIGWEAELQGRAIAWPKKS